MGWGAERSTLASLPSPSGAMEASGSALIALGSSASSPPLATVTLIAYAAARALGSLLLGVRPNNPLTVVVAAACFGTAITACVRLRFAPLGSIHSPPFEPIEGRRRSVGRLTQY